MRARRSAWLLAVAVAALTAAACDDGGIGPPRVTPPRAPAANDPAFAVEGIQPWYLVGNDLTDGQDRVELTIRAPLETDVVDVWLAGGAGQRLARVEAGTFTTSLPLEALGGGEHELLFAADGAETAFARTTLRRTHPLYFVMSTDWDFADPGVDSLAAHDRLRTNHPAIRFTHFIGPYTFTDPVLPAARKDELAAWARLQRDTHGDEIGLHIHPWCHFVEAAGLTCRTDDSTVYDTDVSGYTIKCSSYPQAEFEQLLDTADQIFTDRGLGKPVTFRAGGWTASVDTLAALAARGYVADTSANNWARMEEWRGEGNGELYTWNMQTWSQIGDTSQPYYPNTVDKQSAMAPWIPILEVPDNAIMVDYVTTAEMIEIFGANWPGTPLVAPKVFMMGFHPSQNWTSAEYNRLDGILDHADQFQATNHAGPVVYTLLRDLPRVWPRP